MIIQVLIIFAGVSNYFAHPAEPSMVLDTWGLSVAFHLSAFINSYPLPLLSRPRPWFYVLFLSDFAYVSCIF